MVHGVPNILGLALLFSSILILTLGARWKRSIMVKTGAAFFAASYIIIFGARLVEWIK